MSGGVAVKVEPAEHDHHDHDERDRDHDDTKYAPEEHDDANGDYY